MVAELPVKSFHMFRIFISWLAVLLLLSCTAENKKIDREKVQNEIRDAERAFEQMAADSGIAHAFWYYADSAAVIRRENDTLIIGREPIRQYYSTPSFQTAKVSWAPDHVQVSDDGSMAWTYGKYLWRNTDSTGGTQSFTGVFHTVWKRQADGSWRYVWD
jgi:ketosteroid isomerase-like protein